MDCPVADRRLFRFMLLAALWFPVAGVFAAPQTIKDELTGMTFVNIPGACFPMGVDQAGEVTHDAYLLPPRANEIPRHEVCVNSFWMAKTETTNAQWGRLMPTISSGTGSELPVTGVTFEQVERFILQINERAKGASYRLPSEAEWEHACREGKEQDSAGDPAYASREPLRKHAFFLDDRRLNRGPMPTGSLAPNVYGLHDMLGNVWEWTADSYADDGYLRHGKDNPRLTESTGRHVIRGGSWKSHEFSVRCGGRNWSVRDDRLDTVGFRLVLVRKAN